MIGPQPFVTHAGARPDERAIKPAQVAAVTGRADMVWLWTQPTHAELGYPQATAETCRASVSSCAGEGRQPPEGRSTDGVL